MGSTEIEMHKMCQEELFFFFFLRIFAWFFLMLLFGASQKGHVEVVKLLLDEPWMISLGLGVR